MAQMKRKVSWYQHARLYVEMKWPTLAAKSRRSLAEALSTITPALVSKAPRAPDDRTLRLALFGWAFNPGMWSREVPDEIADALAWMEEASVQVAKLNDPEWVRRALVACSQTTRGKPAAATVTRRKRAVFYNALRYAVELLPANPLDRLPWKPAEIAETVDRRVVANPGQVRSLLTAVGQQGEMGKHLVPFFGCLYFAGMRPAEALALRRSDCMLPRYGWGRLNLA
jgi:integrase